MASSPSSDRAPHPTHQADQYQADPSSDESGYHPGRDEKREAPSYHRTHDSVSPREKETDDQAQDDGKNRTGDHFTVGMNSGGLFWCLIGSLNSV